MAVMLVRTAAQILTEAGVPGAYRRWQTRQVKQH